MASVNVPSVSGLAVLTTIEQLGARLHRVQSRAGRRRKCAPTALDKLTPLRFAIRAEAGRYPLLAAEFDDEKVSCHSHALKYLPLYYPLSGVDDEDPCRL